jgi:hypothetical protein
MSKKSYVLVDIIPGKSQQIMEMLQQMPRVTVAEPLAGASDLLVTIEAPEWDKLAESLVEVISTVDGVADSLRLFVARDKIAIPAAIS